MLNHSIAYQDNRGIDDIIERRYLEESRITQNKQVGLRQNIQNALGYEHQSQRSTTIVEHPA